MDTILMNNMNRVQFYINYKYEVYTTIYLTKHFQIIQIYHNNNKKKQIFYLQALTGPRKLNKLFKYSEEKISKTLFPKTTERGYWLPQNIVFFQILK